MSKWEQRITSWGALAIAGFSFIFSAVTLWLVYHLDRDRFQNPFAADVGVKWEQKHVVGGIDTVPVQYKDDITLTNMGDTSLDNVALVIANWNSATEVVVMVGTLEPKKEKKVDLLPSRGFSRAPYEIDPRDVVIIRCPGYADKRIPVKDLGKEKLLRDIEKEEDKKKNADPEYWRKRSRWEEELEKMGIEPTKEMYEKWLRDKEAERNKKPS